MNPIERVRALCLALPEAFEIETWGHPTFRVGSSRGKIFCTTATDGSLITVKPDSIERDALLAHGGPFFIPPYVGTKGWIAIRSDDAAANWQKITELIASSYCLIAPSGSRRESRVRRQSTVDRN